MKNADFMTNIVKYICDYAIENGLDPNETLSIVAKGILVLLKIADFSEWGSDDG